MMPSPAEDGRPVHRRPHRGPPLVRLMGSRRTESPELLLTTSTSESPVPPVLNDDTNLSLLARAFEAAAQGYRQHVLLSAMALDRPGLIRELIRPFLSLETQLQGAEQAVMAGQCSVMIALSTPPTMDVGEVSHQLQTEWSELITGDRRLRFRLWNALELGDQAVQEMGHECWNLYVRVAEAPGIIAQVASEIADHDAWIRRFTSRIVFEDLGDAQEQDMGGIWQSDETGLQEEEGKIEYCVVEMSVMVPREGTRRSTIYHDIRDLCNRIGAHDWQFVRGDRPPIAQGLAESGRSGHAALTVQGKAKVGFVADVASKISSHAVDADSAPDDSQISVIAAEMAVLGSHTSMTLLLESLIEERKWDLVGTLEDTFRDYSFKGAPIRYLISSVEPATTATRRELDDDQVWTAVVHVSGHELSTVHRILEPMDESNINVDGMQIRMHDIAPEQEIWLRLTAPNEAFDKNFSVELREVVDGLGGHVNFMPRSRRI